MCLEIRNSCPTPPILGKDCGRQQRQGDPWRGLTREGGDGGGVTASIGFKEVERKVVIHQLKMFGKGPRCQSHRGAKGRVQVLQGLGAPHSHLPS